MDLEAIRAACANTTNPKSDAPWMVPAWWVPALVDEVERLRDALQMIHAQTMNAVNVEAALKTIGLIARAALAGEEA